MTRARVRAGEMYEFEAFNFSFVLFYIDFFSSLSSAKKRARVHRLTLLCLFYCCCCSSSSSPSFAELFLLMYDERGMSDDTIDILCACDTSYACETSCSRDLVLLGWCVQLLPFSVLFRENF